MSSMSPPPLPPRLDPLQRARLMALSRDFRLVDYGRYNASVYFLTYLNAFLDVGWKLHVAKPAVIDRANPQTLPPAYRALLLYLVRERIPHKIVRNWGMLEKMEMDIGQRGKFITIYPANSAQMLRIAELIDLVMRTEPGYPAPALGANPPPRIARKDLMVGPTGSIGARWGGLTSEYAIDAGNRRVLDDRTRPKPDWVKNPFDPGSQGLDTWCNFPPANANRAAIMLESQDDWEVYDPNKKKNDTDEKSGKPPF